MVHLRMAVVIKKNSGECDRSVCIPLADRIWSFDKRRLAAILMTFTSALQTALRCTLKCTLICTIHSTARKFLLYGVVHTVRFMTKYFRTCMIFPVRAKIASE